MKFKQTFTPRTGLVRFSNDSVFLEETKDRNRRGRCRCVAVREPLLPQHVVYRSPHPSDALLQFALRLLVDGPPTPKPYRRYYLAT